MFLSVRFQEVETLLIRGIDSTLYRNNLVFGTPILLVQTTYQDQQDSQAMYRTSKTLVA